nr:unnamed protein product [Callosobruchus chinensis]
MDEDSDEILIADNLNEPQVTSKDPNERKLARRIRIEKRWNVIRRLTMPTEVLSERINSDPVQFQMQKSEELLQKYISVAKEEITNVRVDCDAREVDRREMEGIGREKVIEQLEAEATAAAEMFHEIAKKWISIQKYQDPLRIHEEIASQREKCDVLINQKDEIIAMLRDELKLANKRFDKDQHKQIDEINTLTQRIEKQLTFMRKSYQMERQLIEDAFMMERQRVIEENNKKWEDLYKKREQEENMIAERKMHRLEEFNEKMTEIRVDYQERFRETKITIERDIEFMQRELERIKALALVNSEKLDYNYQILKTREDENLIIKSQNKRRMNKLQDAVRAMKQKIRDYKISTENRIEKLTLGIQKLHQSIMDIDAKADRFATINDEKFHKVWDINTAIIKKMLKKIEATDKILYEQQMGIEWQEPNQSAIVKTQLQSYKNAMKTLFPSACAVKQRMSTTSKDSTVSVLSTTITQQGDFIVDNKRETDICSAPITECYTNLYYKRLVKHILKQVSDKSGFLTEAMLKKLLKGYQDDQQTITTEKFQKVMLLKRYAVEGYYKAGKALPTTRERLERKRLTISRLMTNEDIKLYWEKFRLIYNEDRVKIWDALLQGLTYYHEILKKRRNLCEQVVSLRSQNEDLKKLDPNERKLARRLRIERRTMTIKRLTQGYLDIPENIEPSPVDQQKQESAEVLEKYIAEAEEYITNVRVASDAREVDRRETEGIGREKIIQQLDEEAEAATEKFHEIAEKWSKIQKYNDPLHIHDDIANQKEKCDLLIKQKDEIIAMLRNELKEAERKFTKDQYKQMDDINILTQRIEKQITFMRKAYQTEYELIEGVLLMERKKLIEQNNQKWDDLNKRREQQETLNSEKKFQRLEEFNENMTKIRVDNQEKFRETKIELERDIEFMQRELQRIKALALFNGEKLDYNYQILKKRDAENLIIKSQNKIRMNKLQDAVNSMKNKINNYESSTNNQIKQLTEGIKKLHRSIMDIDAKADRFATISEEKFHKIWKVNKSIAEKILKRIIETDRVLHEQQMGVEWEPPLKTVIPKTQLQSYQTALTILHPSILSTVSTSRRMSSMTSKHSVASSKHLMTAKRNESKLGGVPEHPPPEQLDANPTYRKLVGNILKQLSDKSGFLSEQQLKQLMKGYSESKDTLVRLDNIFESLRVQDKEDIDLMIDYFVRYAHCPVCGGLQGSDSLVLNRFASQVSRLSAIFTPGDQEDAIDIQELDKAYHAIQQPEDIIDEVVMELVTSDTFLEERDVSERDAIDDICGEAMLDQYYMDANEMRGESQGSQAVLDCHYHQLLAD